MSLSDVSLRNATDASVTQDRPNRNSVQSTRLTIRGGSTAQSFAFVHFARPVPLGATVLSATLTLWMEAPGSGTKVVTLKKVTESWKAGQVTWNNRPNVSGSGAVNYNMVSGTAPQAVTFDVKNFLQAVADGGSWYGWRVELDLDSVRSLNSANASAHKPLLEVEYAMKPAKPTGLAPGAGNAVTVLKPLLRFNDVKNLRALQIQINSSSDFSGAVSYDSGTVTTTVPQYDTSTTGTFTGINSGETKYWRVRVQDDGGIWSAWSDVTSFTRAALPVLTLVTPTGNYVDEPTPVISWTFTGTTQRAWRVFVKDVNDNIVSDSKQQAGTATSYEIPSGVITDKNATYTIYVRVWDNISRDGADNPWFQVNRAVTYRYSNTVAPVTSLVGTSLEPKPGVLLTWSRSTAPDSFNIRAGNGKLIENVLAADALVSGTNYQYIDYTAEPNTSQRWSVEAVVNGITSDLSPNTAYIKPKVVGIWISDPENGVAVQLLDVDQGTWEMGEESAIFAPVGSSRAFKVTQALRGYEGSINGLLLETTMTNKTISEQEDDMWSIKSNPNRTYILTLADMAIPVVLGNIVVSPSPQKEPQKGVSFDFWQVKNVPFKYSP